jgi:phosphoglycolate phosphatase
MLKKKFKLLVFDWDGTLADSEKFIINAMQDAIKQQNLSMHTREEIRNIIGLGLMEASAVLFPELMIFFISPDVLMKHYPSPIHRCCWTL